MRFDGHRSTSRRHRSQRASVEPPAHLNRAGSWFLEEGPLSCCRAWACNITIPHNQHDCTQHEERRRTRVDIAGLIFWGPWVQVHCGGDRLFRGGTFLRSTEPNRPREGERIQGDVECDGRTQTRCAGKLWCWVGPCGVQAMSEGRICGCDGPAAAST